MSIDENALEYTQRNAATIDTDPALVRAIIGWYTNHLAKSEPAKETPESLHIEKTCKETRQPDGCARAFDLFRRVKGQWMMDNQRLALDCNFTEQAEKFAFDMIWNMRPPEREQAQLS